MTRPISAPAAKSSRWEPRFLCFVFDAVFSVASLPAQQPAPQSASQPASQAPAAQQQPATLPADQQADTSPVIKLGVNEVNLIFTVVAIVTVDKLGRKPLQIIGALVMAVAMLALGSTFALQIKGVLALLCMLLYIAGFAVSWGPVVWVLLSEIFPNQIRGKAMAVAVAAQWIANYLVSWTFPVLDKNPYLVEHFKHGFTYWIYGAMGVLAALFMAKFVPETKGRSLEQMEALWQAPGDRLP